jgi:apolipoprotein N-acyltransferase
MLIRVAKKPLCAIVAGLSMAIVMPGLPFGLLSFVALVPLLFALENADFISFFLVGVTFFLVNLRWLFSLARFDILAIPGVIILCLYLACYFGLFGLLMRVIRKRWRNDSLLLVVFPVFFTLFEILRNIGPLSLGFASMYQSLYLYPVLIQVSAYLGPYSITALIALVNVLFYLAIDRKRFLYAAFALATVGAMASLWFLPAPDVGGSLKVAIIGSDVSQEDKLDERNLHTLLDHYVGLGRKAATYDPDLIVFPESILPGYILRDEKLLDEFAKLAQGLKASVVFGTGDYVQGKIYNSVAAIDLNGRVAGTYNMVHPVPFGEFIPGRSLLEKLGLKEFIDSFLPREVTPGNSYNPLNGVGTPICFESALPVASRRFTFNGASLLAIVTNDAWFAGSSELQAHFSFTVFRAVESRRYVLQAANGGISGVIDQRGRIVSSQMGEGILLAEVKTLTGRSFYTRYGDVPLYIIFAISFLSVVIVGTVRRRKGRA